MKLEEVPGYSNLLRVDNSYIINNDRTEYEKALSRLETNNALENRINILESKLDSILEILRGK